MTRLLSIRNLLIAVLIVALLGLHHVTFLSMVHSWASNSTYNHGFTIPFIAAYFAWQHRDGAQLHPARVWWPGLILVAGLSVIWAIGTLVNVQVVSQMASVVMVGAIVLSMAGRAQAQVFALPLIYLLFAVPFGEGIVPLLMVWTADFTVAALDLVGIPVIRDGLYFSIPSGHFEVAKACSGVRYLLASAAAGVAFAFFTYNGWKKRLVFILASLIVPIIANGLRAFGIVLIAHFSDMRLATGIDHFIYGWIFFGIIIIALFLVGGRFADSHAEGKITTIPGGDAAPSAWSARMSELGIAGLAVLCLIAAGPFFVQYQAYTAKTPRPALPEASDFDARWRGPAMSTLDWQLDFNGATATVAGAYEGNGTTVQVRAAAYGNQMQGAELINSENRVAQEDRWKIVGLGLWHTQLEVISDVRAARIISNNESYLVWYWFQQGGVTTTSSYKAKWLEMLSIPDSSPAVVIAIAVAAPDDEARRMLTLFLNDAANALSICVAKMDDGPGCVIPVMPASKS